MSALSVDTETTGLDLYHGARPFIVTTCDEESNVEFWEWDVDPLTRQPHIPKKDLKDIKDKILSYDTIVMHNSKFDLAVLSFLYPDMDSWWNWDCLFDTLYSCHLLNSQELKDLTTAAAVYLNAAIAHYEDDMALIVDACRRAVRKKNSPFEGWMIAKKGLACMPSAKDKVWKYDTWLPRAVAKFEDRHEDDPYWTVTNEYANVDSEVTISLYQTHKEFIEFNNLEKIWAERLKIIPIVFEMERKGVTVDKRNLKELQAKFGDMSDALGKRCQNIAKTYDFDLQLPKIKLNNSVREFAFDVLQLPTIEQTKSGAPSLNKKSVDTYIATMRHQSKEYKFLESLRDYSLCNTARSYMNSYSLFGLDLTESEYESYLLLHPWVNPVGTRTLRWSSSNPNEQNISKKEGFNVRYCFGPKPGREWWSLDYDNLELRIPAFEAKEEEMMKLFLEPDAPPYFGSYHMLVFDTLHPQMFAKHGLDCKKVFKSTWYQWTKNGNFAVQYGAIEESGTADAAYHVMGAQRRIQSRFNRIKALNQLQIDLANERGYVETIPDNVVDPDRGYPLFCETDYKGRVKPTVPLNYHIQGTACWVLMMAMIEVQEYLNELGPDYYIVMNVHDEIVLDFPKKHNKGNLPKINRIRRIMESMGNRINVPLTCGVDYHPHNWATAA